MNITKDFKEVSAKAPARQGFYLARTEKGEELVAEWREYDKKAGKKWWRYESDDPTKEKQPVELAGVTHYAPATKAQVDALLKRKLTEDEKMQRAYDSFRLSEDLYQPFLRPIPPGRELKVGDPVVVGMLKDCVVAQLRDEGRTVIIKYHDLRSVYGKNVDAGMRYTAQFWTEVHKKLDTYADAQVRTSELWDCYRTSSLHSLFTRMRHGVNDSPDYQRGYAWTDDDKQRYLDSLMLGRDLGRFVFVKRKYPQPDELLDGKQRLNCLLDFYTSALAWRGVRFHELSPGHRDRIENRSVQYADIDGQRHTRAQLLQMFLEVNAAGVPQTEDHLAFVKKLLDTELAGAATHGNR